MHPAATFTWVLKQYNLKPDIRYVSINEFSVLSMVEHGLGITLLPACFCGDRPVILSAAA